MGYTKLDSGLLESSVWAEDSDTLRIWIYLLAKCDSIGVVYATLPGVAVQCGLPLEKVIAVLERFAQPDPYSRDAKSDGRRITIHREPEFCIEVLNYSRYRTRTLTHAERQQRYRESHRDGVSDEMSQNVTKKETKVTQGRRHRKTKDLATSANAESPVSSPHGKKKDSDPRVRRLVTFFADEYERTQGLKPYIAHGKTEAQFKRLLAVGDVDEDEFRRVITSFFDNPFRWNEDNLNYDPGCFVSIFNKLRKRLRGE